MASLGSSNSRHRELDSARVERGNSGFSKILTWFRNQNPFTTSEKLVCLDSGFIDENNTVNCDKAEKIGAGILTSLDNEVFASFSFKRKDQITHLQSLYSSIISEKELVAIYLLILFLRLVLADRKSEVKIEDCFYHELAPYPTALFKDGEMRTTKNKSALKHFLLEGVKPSENIDSKIIADECALLQLYKWTKGEKFSKIFEMYIDRCEKFNFNTVVFNWYNKLLKMLHTKQDLTKCLKLLKLVMKIFVLR